MNFAVESHSPQVNLQMREKRHWRTNHFNSITPEGWKKNSERQALYSALGVNGLKKGSVSAFSETPMDFDQQTEVS